MSEFALSPEETGGFSFPSNLFLNFPSRPDVLQMLDTVFSHLR